MSKSVVQPLPKGAVGLLPTIASWLQSAEADFQTVDNTKICKNTDGLVTACDELLKQFAAEVNVQLFHLIQASPQGNYLC
jgi:hypothetical protein